VAYSPARPGSSCWYPCPTPPRGRARALPNSSIRVKLRRLKGAAECGPLPRCALETEHEKREERDDRTVLIRPWLFCSGRRLRWWLTEVREVATRV